MKVEQKIHGNEKIFTFSNFLDKNNVEEMAFPIKAQPSQRNPDCHEIKFWISFEDPKPINEHFKSMKINKRASPFYLLKIHFFKESGEFVTDHIGYDLNLMVCQNIIRQFRQRFLGDT